LIFREQTHRPSEPISELQIREGIEQRLEVITDHNFEKTIEKLRHMKPHLNNHPRTNQRTPTPKKIERAEKSTTAQTPEAFKQKNSTNVKEFLP